MSASETNVKKQTKRHKGPLIGMIAVLVFALGLFVWWLMYEAAEGTPPQGADVSIDGRTGDATLDRADPVTGEPGGTSTPATQVPAN